MSDPISSVELTITIAFRNEDGEPVGERFTFDARELIAVQTGFLPGK